MNLVQLSIGKVCLPFKFKKRNTSVFTEVFPVVVDVVERTVTTYFVLVYFLFFGAMFVFVTFAVHKIHAYSKKRK